MNCSQSCKITDLIPTSNSQYGNTAMGVATLIMLTGQWLLKLKKRLSSNETKMQDLERKLSMMKRQPVTEL